jgi:hypothetical protein
MDQPSHSYGLAGTNRHEFSGPKAFGALECLPRRSSAKAGGGPPQDGFALANLTPLSEARLVIADLADNLLGGRPWAACCRRNLGEVFDQYKAKSYAIEYSG